MAEYAVHLVRLFQLVGTQMKILICNNFPERLNIAMLLSRAKDVSLLLVTTQDKNSASWPLELVKRFGLKQWNVEMISTQSWDRFFTVKRNGSHWLKRAARFQRSVIAKNTKQYAGRSKI